MGNREKDQNENWPKREGKRKTGGQDEGKEKGEKKTRENSGKGVFSETGSANRRTKQQKARSDPDGIETRLFPF